MLPLILPAFDYLISIRKITEQTVRHFGLGYCDPQGEIYMPAEFTGTLPTLPVTMRDSVLFPIENLYGQVISVSCRPLGSTQSKYINTSYEKADHLYGLSKTYSDLLKEQVAYVVEGNFSMLTPWQNGVKNIVAMLGSNMSQKQICLLSRFVKKVVFVSDKDRAGEKFIDKLKRIIPSKWYDADLEFVYINLPQGSDPDDFFIKLGGTFADFKSLPENRLV